MSMHHLLGLRKPDKRFDSMHRSESYSQQVSRLFKKNNIKDILVRNFFRKYPIGIDVSDIDQIKLEKEAAKDFENFVAQTKEINSKNLNAHEQYLATKFNLKRSQTTHSQDNRGSFLSPQPEARAKGDYGDSNVRS